MNVRFVIWYYVHQAKGNFVVLGSEIWDVTTNKLKGLCIVVLQVNYSYREFRYEYFFLRLRYEYLRRPSYHSESRRFRCYCNTPKWIWIWCFKAIKYSTPSVSKYKMF
jgi:hypothetical protein